MREPKKEKEIDVRLKVALAVIDGTRLQISAEKVLEESTPISEWILGNDSKSACETEGSKELPDDPHDALLAIAEHIDTMQKGEEFHYPQGGDKRASKGAWQTWDFIYGLNTISHEAKRIGGSKGE